MQRSFLALSVGSLIFGVGLLHVSRGAELASPWRPTPGWTTGSTTTLTAADLCAKTFRTGSERPDVDYTEALKRSQLQEPRYTDKNPKHYEEDHLISLEIGGHPSDPHNLWPEPYNGPCGAHTKDKLENKLHDLVCAGALSLSEAQGEIASDWVRSYNLHVGRLSCP